MSDIAKAPSPQPSNDIVIAKISNGRRGEELRVAISTFKGRKFLAIRVWYADDSGEMRPSGKGVNVKIELLLQVGAALDQAETLARAEGMIS